MSSLTLVTGATGFIGSQLVQQLLERGERVRVLVRTPEKLRQVGLDPEADGLDVASGDLLEPVTIAQALEGVERVHHIAGWITTRRGNRKRLDDLNVTTTENLFGACANSDVDRIVYLASIFALAGGGPTPVNEDAPWDLDSLAVDYVQSKRVAELNARAWAERGLPLVFVYPCFCYGPNDVYDSSSELIVSFLKRRLPLAPAGGQNAMDVRDAATGLILGMERGKIGERYLVGGENTTYVDMLQILGRITQRRAPRRKLPPTLARVSGRLAERVSKDPPLDEQGALLTERFWWYDDSKARRELGYASRPLEETLREAVAWHSERI